VNCVWKVLGGFGNGAVEIWNGFWGDWWPTIQWGSAGEWVGGIGTIAAVAVAVRALTKDLDFRKRAFADNVSVWLHVRGHKKTDGSDGWEKHVATAKIYNGNNSPIPYGTLLGPEDKFRVTNIPFDVKQHETHGVVHDKKSTGVIDANDRFEISWTYEGELESREFHLAFRDNAGTMWYKNIDTGRYISLRKLKKIHTKGFGSKIVSEYAANEPVAINPPEGDVGN
jgi:hypothetical protein